MPRDAAPRPPYDPARVEQAVREILLALGEDLDREGVRATPARVARAYRELFAGLWEDPGEVLATTFDVGLDGASHHAADHGAGHSADQKVDHDVGTGAGHGEGHDGLVLVRDIPLMSTCEHHLLPFTGIAHVGYLPGSDGRITGLSKLARLVDVYARRPQVQERLTAQVADALVDGLKPLGAIVVIECEHLCMSMRGVRKPGAKTITSAVRGALLDNAATRAEAMSLLTR